MAAITKPVKKEIAIEGWRNPMMLTVHPNGLLEMREKGGRISYFARLDGIFARAVQANGRKK